ncbi:hypothetical protein PUN28_005660 [Cardiocondyla obscurior]|uniref:Uncharacterized protein n=1 Tax=Cardiocondyla obscurior TaxID=286306 RepID=A0AAW2G6K6_9HYME
MKFSRCGLSWRGVSSLTLISTSSRYLSRSVPAMLRKYLPRALRDENNKSRTLRERVFPLEFGNARKEDEVAFERATLSNMLPGATLGYRATLIVSITWNPNESMLVEPREPLPSPRVLSFKLFVTRGTFNCEKLYVYRATP